MALYALRSIIMDTTVIVAAVPLSAPTNRIKSVLGFELPISRMFIGFALADVLLMVDGLSLKLDVRV